MASQTALRQPLSATRMGQIVTDACTSSLEGVQYYDHNKVEQWNTDIVNACLRALVSENPPPQRRYIVQSTIVQHLIPSSMLNKPAAPTASTGTTVGGDVKSESHETAAAPHPGRRGMHSAAGAFWDENTDGMFSKKYDGLESMGLDVVVMIIWLKNGS